MQQTSTTTNASAATTAQLLPAWRVVNDPEEIHQFRGFMAVLGGCGPSSRQLGKFWWNVKSTPVSDQSGCNYADTLEEAKARVEKYLEPYIARMTGKPLVIDREEYRGERGIAQWWPKDGNWHVATPCADPDPITGLKTGGFRYNSLSFATKEEAVLWLNNY